VHARSKQHNLFLAGLFTRDTSCRCKNDNSKCFDEKIEERNFLLREAADVLKSNSATSIVVPPTSPEGGHVYLFKPDKEANAGRWKDAHAIFAV